MKASLCESSLDSEYLLTLLGHILSDDTEGHIWSLSPNSLVRFDSAALKSYMANDFGEHQVFIAMNDGVASGLFAALNLEERPSEANLLTWVSPRCRRTFLVMHWWVKFLLEQQTAGVQKLNAKIKAANLTSAKTLQKLSFNKTDVSTDETGVPRHIFHYRTTEYTKKERAFLSRSGIAK